MKFLQVENPKVTQILKPQTKGSGDRLDHDLHPQREALIDQALAPFCRMACLPIRA